MLRNVLGEAAFRKGIRLYVSRHAGQTVETEQLKIALEDASGRSLTWFFDQWVRHGGHPEIDASWTYDEDSRSVRVTVDQRQCVDDLTPLFRFPLDISFLSRGEEPRTHEIWIDDAHEEFVFGTASEPAAVLIDPGNEVLKTLKMKRDAGESAFVLENSTSVDARCRAAEDLGSSAERSALPALTRALFRDPSYIVGKSAAKALGVLGTEAARDTLVKAMSTHPESKVRQEVARALGRFLNDETAAAGLAKALREDRSYYVAGLAGESLGKLRTPDAAPALVAALSRESFDETIRRGIFDGLSESRNVATMPTLKSWCAPGRPARAREQAVKAVGKLGYWAEPRVRIETREFLASLLEDPLFRIQLAAVEALGELGEAGAAEVLNRKKAVVIDFRLSSAVQKALDKIAAKSAENGSRRTASAVEELQRENKELKERIARLEERLETP
jgi:aminopeptidase N